MGYWTWMDKQLATFCTIRLAYMQLDDDLSGPTSSRLPDLSFSVSLSVSSLQLVNVFVFASVNLLVDSTDQQTSYLPLWFIELQRLSSFTNRHTHHGTHAIDIQSLSLSSVHSYLYLLRSIGIISTWIISCCIQHHSSLQQQ